MFEELKKQCYDALQNTGPSDDGIDVISLDNTAFVSRTDLKSLYIFLIEMEAKKEPKEMKKYAQEKFDEVPYIIDFNKKSNLSKFQEWMEKTAKNKELKEL